MNHTATEENTQASSEAALPTFKQLAKMFLVRANRELRFLQDVRKRDGEWLEKDVSVDLAVGLVYERVQKMMDAELPDAESFAHSWFQASAVVELGVSTFSRPGSCYGRILQGIAEFFKQAPEMLEYAADAE